MSLSRSLWNNFFMATSALLLVAWVSIFAYLRMRDDSCDKRCHPHRGAVIEGTCYCAVEKDIYKKESKEND